MVKKLEAPYPATKRGLPWEIKYDYVRGMLTTLLKGFLYAVREKYGGPASLEIYELLEKKFDRLKIMTKHLIDVFKIEGNNIETIMTWWEIFYELVGVEATWLEVTKTIARIKITKCPWSTPDPKDISDWELNFNINVSKTINPEVTVERPKSMCAGDTYCEYIWKIEQLANILSS